MNVKEWRSHEDAELAFQLKELQKRLFDLRFRQSADEIQDVKEVQKVRRDIARVLTVQNERRLSERRGQNQGQTAGTEG